MDFKLNEEQSKMVEDNIGLVYFVLKKMKIVEEIYDDVYSEASIALMQAVYHFDKSKNYQFSTFAVTCIKYKIYRYLELYKRKGVEISLSTPIKTESDCTISDFLEDDKINIAETYMKQDEFQYFVNKIIYTLKFRERTVILFLLAGFSLKYISCYFNLSTSSIAHIRDKAFEKLKKNIDLPISEKEDYKIEMKENDYCITFVTKEIKNFSSIFSQLLTQLRTMKGIPTFQLNCNRERIIMHLPADLTSFAFIARIFEHIDTYGIQYTVSAKDYAPEEALTIDQSSYVSIPSSKIADLNTNAYLSKEKKIENKKMEEKKVYHERLKLVYQYIQRVESFTLKDILNHIPDTSYKPVCDYIYRLRKKGEVIQLDRGIYSFQKKKTIKPKSPTIPLREKTKKQQLIDCIFSIQQFKVKELQQKFPEIHYQTMAKVIKELCNQNLLQRKSVGTYEVVS